MASLPWVPLPVTRRSPEARRHRGRAAVLALGPRRVRRQLKGPQVPGVEEGSLGPGGEAVSVARPVPAALRRRRSGRPHLSHSRLSSHRPQFNKDCRLGGREGRARPGGTLGRWARRPEAGRPGSLPLGAQAGHRVWVRPHLLENLQRREGRVSAVALATALSHCDEPGSGRRFFLKEHEANRSPAPESAGAGLLPGAPSRGSAGVPPGGPAVLGPAVPADGRGRARGSLPAGPRPNTAQGLGVA